MLSLAFKNCDIESQKDFSWIVEVHMKYLILYKSENEVKIKNQLKNREKGLILTPPFGTFVSFDYLFVEIN